MAEDATTLHMYWTHIIVMLNHDLIGMDEEDDGESKDWYYFKVTMIC